MKKIFTLAAAILASLSLTWADPTVEILNSNFTQWATTPPENSGLSNKNTYTITDGVSNVATVVGSGCKLNDTKNKPTSTGITGYNTNKFRFGSAGNYLYITPVANFIEGGKIRLLISAEKTSESDILGTVYIGESHNLGNIHGWTEKATCNWQEFDIPASVTGTTAEIRITRTDNTLFLWGIQVLTNEACTDPEAHLAFRKSTAYVGEQFTYDFGSKNNGALTTTYTLDGVPAVEKTDYTFTSGNISVLKAGQFVMRMTKDAEGGYCAVDVSDTILIYEATPVASVTVDGPTAGVIGQNLTYTANAANADSYEWYVDGVAANNNSATFVYTAVKGNHVIFCEARNKFNKDGETETWMKSNEINLAVTKVCGELIAFTAETGSSNIDKDITATGVVGGTVHQNTYKNAKLGENGKFISLTLANGSFMKEDVVDIVITPEGNEFKVPGTVKLSSVLDNTDFIGQATGLSATSSEDITATIVLEKGANTIYLSRTSSLGQNPIVKSISVTRSCEESSDASIASLTINGEEVEEKEGVFAYTVSAKENLAEVAVAYTIHPLATATPASGFNVDVPTAGAPANTQVITVTAEDGTQKEYTVSIAKAAALSTDATLKALSVEGFELTPAFDSEVIEYTITKAYEAELPATTKVTAETNDANATVVVSYDAEVKNQINIVVTAEDEETSKEYHIAVLSAEAVKSLSRVLFSNGFDAFIDNTNRTVKAFYLQGEEAPTATTITAGANCTAGEIVDDKIVVTGADESLAEYAVTLEAVAANTNTVEETAEAGAFDGTETWVKAGLYMGNEAGFNEGKYVLRRQLKSSDAADDQRVIAGLVRAYFFVGNASKLELANTTKNVKVKYAVDGGEYTESEANPLVILLEEGNHMIEVVTNQSSGDCNLSAPKLVKRISTALGNTEAEAKAVKVVRDGQLLILKNGVLYNAQGAIVK